MLETSPLLSNRYKRISSRPPSPSSTGVVNRRKSSITFLLALTAISAIVTYYYDSNLAPYSTLDDGSNMGFSVNQDFLTSVKEGSIVDEYGYRLSEEQRSLARSMNVEKRVSCFIVYVGVLCVSDCRHIMCSYKFLSNTQPLLSPPTNIDHGNDQNSMARMHGPTYASRCM